MLPSPRRTELIGERIAVRARHFVADARCWLVADAWFAKSVVPWPQGAAAWLFAEPPAFGRPGLAPYSERSAPLSPALGPEAAPPVSWCRCASPVPSQASNARSP